MSVLVILQDSLNEHFYLADKAFVLVSPLLKRNQKGEVKLIVFLKKIVIFWGPSKNFAIAFSIRKVYLLTFKEKKFYCLCDAFAFYCNSKSQSLAAQRIQEHL
jgi:hypothetical protein